MSKKDLIKYRRQSTKLGTDVLEPRLWVIPPDSWDDLEEELAANGKLSKDDIADRLRATDKAMPEAIRLFLADALQKRKHFARPRNRYKKREYEHLKERFMPVLDRYRRYVEHVDPNATAITPAFIEKFAARHSVSPRAIDEILYPRTPRK
jgi:hypothetical protein